MRNYKKVIQQNRIIKHFIHFCFLRFFLWEGIFFTCCDLRVKLELRKFLFQIMYLLPLIASFVEVCPVCSLAEYFFMFDVGSFKYLLFLYIYSRYTFLVSVLVGVMLLYCKLYFIVVIFLCYMYCFGCFTC